jgi:hypothetical protein
MSKDRTPEEPRTKDRRKEYLDDLRTIRALMTRYEEQSMVRPWVFVVWGILVLSAVLLSRSGSLGGDMTSREILVSIWVPVLIIGGGLETVGWYQHARSAGTALVSGRMARLFLTGGGIIVLMAIVVLAMLPVGLSPAVVLAVAASPILMYALMTYASLFIEAYLLLAAAALLMTPWMTDRPELFGATEAGLLAGVTFMVVGVHTAMAEKKHRTERNG